MKTVDISNLTKTEAKQLIIQGKIIEFKGKLYGNEDYESYKNHISLSEYNEMLQGVRKVLLNSSYGATLNEWCRFHDPRLGASTTGSGRQVTTFMLETITEQLTGRHIPLVKTTDVDEETGEVENFYTIDCPTGLGPIMSDTDSVASESIVKINNNAKSISEHFDNLCNNNIITYDGSKEILWLDQIALSPCYDPITQQISQKQISGIYRHKVSKSRYKITLNSGQSVIVTGDHSVMVERDGFLIEVKPYDVIDTDTCIRYHFDDMKSKIKSVEKLSDFEDEYVYDVIMRDSSTPYFFADGVLVHNSCYFLLDALVKDIPDENDKINMAVELSDTIVKNVNNGFSEFTKLAFNCQPNFIGKITANREIVAKSGIIRAKKNYTFLVVDNEGKRYDEPKLKLQGGDLKIKSTPETVRSFLSKMTMKILTGVSQQEISNDVISFRDSLTGEALKDPLSYATISTVKTLGEYQDKWKRIEHAGMGKVNLPGHIRAAINYNWCIDQFAPSESQLISGAKVKILCVAKNEWGFTTIAFPTDMEILPQWFTDRFELDVKLTEQKMIDAKVGNTFNPIGWTIPTRNSVLRTKLFEF